MCTTTSGDGIHKAGDDKIYNYKYKIGYTTFEESEFEELTHDVLFPYNEITNMIAQATAKAAHSDPDGDHGNAFQRYFSDVIDVLVCDYGFKRIEYDLIWSTFGWAPVIDDGTWRLEIEQHPELQVIQDAVKNYKE
jgi:hypothetical protein